MSPAPLRLEDVPAGWDAIVVGKVRPAHDGPAIERLHIEPHPALADRALDWIHKTAIERFGLQRAYLVHRSGTMSIGDPIVVCAAWSDDVRRADAACRWMLEATKRHLPVWKRETMDDGEEAWVDGHTMEWPWRE